MNEDGVCPGCDDAEADLACLERYGLCPECLDDQRADESYHMGRDER